MDEIQTKPIALLLSFIIWLKLDITILRNLAKNKYKKKSEKFIEKAKQESNFVTGKVIKSKHCIWTDSNERERDDGYKVTYEYIVNGKKYKKKIHYSNSNYPEEQIIYYKQNNPRNSIGEHEAKNGFIYTLLTMCIPLSIFIGIPISSYLLTLLINLF